ncbi:fibronectin type III domain-containing protein, partial [Thaumarchaeota archaeon SCGC AB-539-E09]
SDTASFTVDQEKDKPHKLPPNEPPKPVTLHIPTNITATSMKLTWTKSTDFDFEQYVIYYFNSAKKLIGNKIAEINKRSMTSYNMTQLDEDTVYYYIVRVVDEGGLDSYSNPVSARTLFTTTVQDKTNPILTIISPVNTVYNHSEVEFFWKTDEELNWVGYELDGQERVTLEGNVTLTDLEDGLYLLVLFGTDLFNNIGSDRISFEVSTFVPDTEPPEIIHSPVTNGVKGVSIDVSAIISDDIGVEEAEIYYRRGGDERFLSLEMNTTGLDSYSVTIPASFVTVETIEYYISTNDGSNPVTHPSTVPALNPHIINVNLPPDPVALNVPLEGAVSPITIILTWSESNAADFENYAVYVSNSQGIIGDPITSITERSEVLYLVENLSPETTYYFTVRVFDTGWLYADSNQLSVETNVVSVPWATYALNFGLLLLLFGAPIAYLYWTRWGQKGSPTPD